MNKLALCLIPGLLALSGGCIALQTPEDLDAQQQQQASLAADVQTLRSERQNLVNMLEAIRQQNAEHEYKILDLQKRLDLVENQLAATNTAYKQELQRVKDTIASESSARVTAINDMKTAVSTELARTASEIQKQLKAMPKSDTSAQGEYTVQKGDTLMMIARAFGVSTDSLRRANGLKGDMLRLGQRLTIPKK